MTTKPERCLLPGCDVEIEQPEGGGPGRKYCTAAHRAAARRLRYEESVGEPQKIQITFPDLPNERTAKQQAAAASAADWRRTVSTKGLRRRRAIAVLGAASILTGGGGMIAANQTPSPVTTAANGANPAKGATPPADGEEWAAQAQVTLASLNQQLDMVAQAEAAWNALPASRREGRPPAAVAALLDKKAQLEQQRATIKAELAAWQSYRSTKDSLNKTNQQLASVDTALKQSQPSAAAAPAERTSADRLAQQRDMLARQRDVQQQELAGWETGVAKAIATPLAAPEPETTRDIVEPVVAITEGSDPTDPQQPLTPDQRVALPSGRGGQEERSEPSQDIGTGAPPHPSRGPDFTIAEAAAAGTPAAAAPTGEWVGTPAPQAGPAPATFAPPDPAATAAGAPAAAAPATFAPTSPVAGSPNPAGAAPAAGPAPAAAAPAAQTPPAPDAPTAAAPAPDPDAPRVGSAKLQPITSTPRTAPNKPATNKPATNKPAAPKATTPNPAAPKATPAPPQATQAFRASYDADLAAKRATADAAQPCDASCVSYRTKKDAANAAYRQQKDAAAKPAAAKGGSAKAASRSTGKPSGPTTTGSRATGKPTSPSTTGTRPTSKPKPSTTGPGKKVAGAATAASAQPSTGSRTR